MTLITIIQYDTNYELLNSYQTVIDDKIELPGNFKLSGILWFISSELFDWDKVVSDLVCIQLNSCNKFL